MDEKKTSFYILHVSDFHISEKSMDDAENALKELSKTLKDENICISYMIHTGDVINSFGIENEIKQQYGKGIVDKPRDEEYNGILKKIAEKRFKDAEKIIKELNKSLEIKKDNIIICCGNHDKLRLHGNKDKEEEFEYFKEFLKNLKDNEEDIELIQSMELDDLRVLVLNTNYSTDKGTACIHCQKVFKKLNENAENKPKNAWYYTYKENDTLAQKKLNVIVAHQPLYDICENIRLPYAETLQTSQMTDFLSALQDFMDGNGVYLCGDKHTSSVIASYIHDIPHYFCGHPFTFKEVEIPSYCQQSNVKKNLQKKIEYNLIEVKKGKIGQVRKICLLKKNTWKGKIYPIDTVAAKLYENSRKYIIRNSFALIASKTGNKRSSLESLSWHNLSNKLCEMINSDDILKQMSEFYSLFYIIRSPKNYIETLEGEHVFEQLHHIIEKSFKSENEFKNQNIMNIRGGYSSSKSTFLGMLYVYLLYQYSQGNTQYIPVYFNMENDAILNKIQEGDSYSSAVQQIFSAFVYKTEEIAEKEYLPVCYIIDGLDEQDIWSESSKDSVGRVTLNILSETKKSKYIMAFCQNNMAQFKNTMPAIKYYEHNYVMYFNSIPVREKTYFEKFVSYVVDDDSKSNKVDDNLCETIKKLRRLSINAGFLCYNYEYLKECKETDSINTVYMKYIDQQYRICLDKLGYGFVDYAPAMAYLFSYEGYTYEKFKNIAPSTTNYWERKIVQNADKIYKTFIFIKKYNDTREYLLALHYTRELRYFAENFKEKIPENSIINKLLPRNISIIIKKLWRTDQNKFIIVCRDLIQKRINDDERIRESTSAMLIYILAYLDQIPAYRKYQIKRMLVDDKGDKVSWKFEGSNLDKIELFVNRMNFQHSVEIYDAINSNNSRDLVKKLIENSEFMLYNRQYVMCYYGDLAIYGENGVNILVPGIDNVNKGMDYHDCFFTLCQKLEDWAKNEKKYPLLEFDLFVVFDLIYSRWLKKNKLSGKQRDSEQERRELERYEEVLDFLKKYFGEEDKENENIGKWIIEDHEKFLENIVAFNVLENPYKKLLTFVQDRQSEINMDEDIVGKFFYLAKEIIMQIIEYSTLKEIKDDIIENNNDNNSSRISVKLCRANEETCETQNEDQESTYTWYCEKEYGKFVKIKDGQDQDKAYCDILVTKENNDQKIYCEIQDKYKVVSKSKIYKLRFQKLEDKKEQEEEIRNIIVKENEDHLKFICEQKEGDKSYNWYYQNTGVKDRKINSKGIRDNIYELDITSQNIGKKIYCKIENGEKIFKSQVREVNLCSKEDNIELSRKVLYKTVETSGCMAKFICEKIETDVSYEWYCQNIDGKFEKLTENERVKDNICELKVTSKNIGRKIYCEIKNREEVFKSQVHELALYHETDILDKNKKTKRKMQYKILKKTDKKENGNKVIILERKDEDISYIWKYKNSEKDELCESAESYVFENIYKIPYQDANKKQKVQCEILLSNGMKEIFEIDDNELKEEKS